MTGTIRVGIVDDHSIFLAGLQHAFRNINGIAIVAEGGTMDEALSIAEKDAPDVLLLDIDMPGNGIEAARQIVGHYPATRVIMLSGSDDDACVSQSIIVGAHGYLVKGASRSEICEAIRAVVGGEGYISARLATRYALQFLREGRRLAEEVDSEDELSARELQVFKYASEGMSNKEIADKLELSLSTIKNNMSCILRKLKSRNRIEALQKREIDK
jgi:DNA-binding NarL/FixJ family response regulator